MGERGTVAAHRGRLLNEATRDWLTALIGRAPTRPDLFIQALTHGSASADNYERLEFLGDRVLGLVIAEWLYEKFAAEPEGRLSSRLNQLVSGELCARIARGIGVQPHLILGKQARDDGAVESVNVLGDVMEALIGALYLESGLDDARALIRRHWAQMMDGAASFAKHPKSALQEWAAANRRKPPEYRLDSREGPDHNLHFTVTVAIRNIGEATATGSSKQEAETAAARALLDQIS